MGDMVRAEYQPLYRNGCELPPAEEDFGKCTKAFNDHNEEIRKKVPKSQLLEFNSQDGWGPLCEFLGVPVPKAAFPWSKKKAGTNMLVILAVASGVMLVVCLIVAVMMSGPPEDRKDRRGQEEQKNSKKKS